LVADTVSVALLPAETVDGAALNTTVGAVDVPSVCTLEQPAVRKMKPIRSTLAAIRGKNSWSFRKPKI
jgi:hypothetical protein